MRSKPTAGRLEVHHRPAPLTPSQVEHSARLYGEGRTLVEVGAEIGRTADVISKYLRRAGVKMNRAGEGRVPHNFMSLPRKELVAKYMGGVSEKALAEAFKVSRAVIRRHLVENGVTPRDRRAGMIVRMQLSAPEQRRLWAQAAHDAVRGSTKSVESKRKSAQAKCQPRGPGEAVIADALRQRGEAFEEQAPIDIYNVDLLVGCVAVEPTCRSTNPMRVARKKKRTEELARRGIATLWVHYRTLDALKGCVEQVLAHLDEMRREPTSSRQHRVIWCALKRPGVRENLNQLPAVRAAVAAKCRRVE